MVFRCGHHIFYVKTLNMKVRRQKTKLRRRNQGNPKYFQVDNYGVFVIVFSHFRHPTFVFLSSYFCDFAYMPLWFCVNFASSFFCDFCMLRLLNKKPMVLTVHGTEVIK